jgi:hypothetical protein
MFLVTQDVGRAKAAFASAPTALLFLRDKRGAPEVLSVTLTSDAYRSISTMLSCPLLLSRSLVRRKAT